jgi:dihydropteroate synthase
MRAKLMGILNVTPDSFYDGGRFIDPSAAIEKGLRLAAEGADIIDVGGESTRPGSGGIDAGEEISRVIPVIEGLKTAVDIHLSIDTRKSRVAEAAIDAGASIVNDISALRFDPKMADLVARRGVELILMHSLGDPETMQIDPQYENVVDDINSFFAERLEYSTSRGIDASKIWIDPGIGFGKTLEHNLEILRRLDEFKTHGVRLLVGPSNKSFIGLVLDQPVDKRLEGTIAACVVAIAKGADMLRVHDVGAVKKAVKLAEAILRGKTVGI